MINTALKISILVPCRNEAEYIRTFLDSLLTQDASGLDCEVIIADGLSDDGTREIINEYICSSDWIRLIDNPTRFVSGGLNQALREATGEIVIRMDVHSEYATNYVQECVRALVQSGAQNVGGPALTKSNGYIGQAIAAAYANPFSCGGARFHNPRYEGYVDTVMYGCWWRKTLEEIGGFDEKLVRNQDDELNLRIIRAGGKIWQTPKIKFWYYPRRSLKALALQYFQYGYWKLAVIRKHRSPASIRHLIPAAFALFVLAGGIGSILGLADPGPSYLVTKIYVTVLSAYMMCDVGAALLTAGFQRLNLWPGLLIIFPIYHLSYGSGFLFALLQQVRFRQHPNNSSIACRLSK